MELIENWLLIIVVVDIWKSSYPTIVLELSQSSFCADALQIVNPLTPEAAKEVKALCDMFGEYLSHIAFR